jgi:hypothetical protein
VFRFVYRRGNNLERRESFCSLSNMLSRRQTEGFYIEMRRSGKVSLLFLRLTVDGSSSPGSNILPHMHLFWTGAWFRIVNCLPYYHSRNALNNALRLQMSLN